VNDCCAPGNKGLKTAKKIRCFDCNQFSAEVSLKTLFHHLKTPWNVKISEQKSYFCENADCEVVYFFSDNDIHLSTELKQTKIPTFVFSLLTE